MDFSRYKLSEEDIQQWRRETEEAERIADLKERNQAFRRIQNKYREKQQALADACRAEALREVGLEGHPKADRAWELAWEFGCISGWDDVLAHLKALACLILD